GECGRRQEGGGGGRRDAPRRGAGVTAARVVADALASVGALRRGLLDLALGAALLGDAAGDGARLAAGRACGALLDRALAALGDHAVGDLGVRVVRDAAHVVAVVGRGRAVAGHGDVGPRLGAPRPTG